VRSDQKDRKKCAYCDNLATTVDHVPPSNIFTPPLPDNLITVPACEACNNGWSADDEVFRNELSIMAGSFGGSANAAERLKTTMRAIRRNKRFLKDFVCGGRPVERLLPSGIYLGWGVAVPVTPDVHERVIRRIVRGLFRHHFYVSLGADVEISLTFIDKTKSTWQKSRAVFCNLQPKYVQVGDGETFHYYYGSASDDPTFSFWILVFFRGAAERIVLACTRQCV
jgi:hypothetical protein